MFSKFDDNGVIAAAQVVKAALGAFLAVTTLVDNFPAIQGDPDFVFIVNLGKKAIITRVKMDIPAPAHREAVVIQSAIRGIIAPIKIDIIGILGEDNGVL